MEHVEVIAGELGVLYESFEIIPNGDGETISITRGYAVIPTPAGPAITFNVDDLSAALEATFNPLPGALLKSIGNVRRPVISGVGGILYQIVDIATDGRILGIIGYDVQTDAGIRPFGAGDLGAALAAVLFPHPDQEEIMGLEDPAPPRI
ncbi:hypothetical protein [Azospirillum sp. B2RO_4]|uniref:hypothetical protein n=1 Tax=Azospirillum sp. B2RO_4 TaxID=3027796 RepID=UPI003DA8711D